MLPYMAKELVGEIRLRILKKEIILDYPYGPKCNHEARKSKEEVGDVMLEAEEWSDMSQGRQVASRNQKRQGNSFSL